MRFFDELTAEYETYLRMPARFRALTHVEDVRNDTYMSRAALLRLLRMEETKRILFDARQATHFDEAGDMPPSHVRSQLHLPFPQFYLEFTEPVLISAQQPGKKDYLRAIFISQYTNKTLEGQIKHSDAEEPQDASWPLIGATMFLRDEGQTQFVERSWNFHLQSGIAFTTVAAALAPTDGGDASSFPPLDLGQADDTYIPACMSVGGEEERHYGWWERTVRSYTDLILWIVTYTMAKSIKIVPEPESRQVRRWRELHHLPPMWHVVKVEPKFYQPQGETEEPQHHHSYRYDVIGHLRFGRHKTREGYSSTIEWVPPHQRGLANELYIPKTYKVEGGKVISGRMREYFREG